MEEIDEQVLSDASVENASHAQCEGDLSVSSKCKSCCCVVHCLVRFHSFNRKPLMNSSMPVMMYGFEDTISGMLGDLGPDMESTVHTMVQVHSDAVGDLMKKISFQI